MMFILGGSRAELPADLAGRRRRRGRAGAPGGSGGDRRGRWREAAPALPPQLSFPSRGRERVGRRERTSASERQQLRRRAYPVQGAAANVGAARGGRAGDEPTGVPAVRGRAPTGGSERRPRGGAFIKVIAGTATPSGWSRRSRGTRWELGPLRPRVRCVRCEGRAARPQRCCTFAVKSPRRDNSNSPFCRKRKYENCSIELQCL